MTNHIKAIIGIVVGLGAIISLAFGTDYRYAKDVEFQEFRKRFEIEKVQRYIWKLEDRYRCSGLNDCMGKMAPHDFTIYRSLLQELDYLTGN